MSTICAYPLSPTYSALPRLNTLILLIFVVHGPADNWATKGALAALMTRTAVISLHAVALLAVLQHQAQQAVQQQMPIDLDSFGAWAILGAVGTAMPMLLGWAPSLRASKARPLVRVWGLMTIIGAVCAYAATVRARALAFTSSHVSQAVGSCSDLSPLPLRRGEEALAIPAGSVFGSPQEKLSKSWSIGAIVMMAFGAWSCLRLGKVGQSAVMTSITDAFNLVQHTQSLKTTAVGIIFERCLIVTSMVFFWGLVALDERIFFRQRMPELEGRDSFEQWSCWIATGLVLLAAMLNWSLERMSRLRDLPTQPFVAEDMVSTEVIV